MHRGYIKSWRKMRDNPVFKDKHALVVFLFLLLGTEWKKGRKILFNGKQIEMVPGQVTFGRYELGIQLRLPPSTVRNAIKRLVSKYEIMDYESDSRMTLVTFRNWATYQSDDESVGLPIGQREDSKWTASGQQVDTLKEVKKIRSKELKNKSFSVMRCSEDEFFSFLKTSELYKNINLEAELLEMDRWLLRNPGRQKTRKFILNWLGRCDRKITQGGQNGANSTDSSKANDKYAHLTKSADSSNQEIINH